MIVKLKVFKVVTYQIEIVMIYLLWANYLILNKSKTVLSNLGIN